MNITQHSSLSPSDALQDPSFKPSSALRMAKVGIRSFFGTLIDKVCICWKRFYGSSVLNLSKNEYATLRKNLAVDEQQRLPLIRQLDSWGELSEPWFQFLKNHDSLKQANIVLGYVDGLSDIDFKQNHDNKKITLVPVVLKGEKFSEDHIVCFRIDHTKNKKITYFDSKGLTVNDRNHSTIRGHEDITLGQLAKKIHEAFPKYSIKENLIQGQTNGRNCGLHVTAVMLASIEALSSGSGDWLDTKFSDESADQFRSRLIQMVTDTLPENWKTTSLSSSTPKSQNVANPIQKQETKRTSSPTQEPQNVAPPAQEEDGYEMI